MIVGLGTDIVQMLRIAAILQKFETRFAETCFTPAERERAAAQPAPANAYARLYAAKEAALKAVGTGMRAGLSWHDLEIGHDDLGKPILTIKDGCARLLTEKAAGPVTTHLSMSDDGDYAVATVILETL